MTNPSMKHKQSDRERGAIKFRDDDEKPIRFAKTRLPKVRRVLDLTLLTSAVKP